MSKHCNWRDLWIRIALALALTGAASNAQAAKLELVPDLDIGALYESNPRYRRENEDEATGLLIDASLEASYDTQTSRFALIPRTRLSFYEEEDDSDLEDRDYWIDAVAEHATTRSNTSVAGGYSDVSVDTSELETADSPNTGGSGDVRFLDDKQKRWIFSPSWQYQLTPKNLLSVTGNYTDVAYDRNALTGRFDYDYLTGSVSLQHGLSESTAVGLVVDGSQYNSENKFADVTNESTSYGASLFVTHQFNETLGVSVYAGASQTDSTVSFPSQQIAIIPPFPPLIIDICPDDGSAPPCNRDSSGTNFVGNIELKKRSERTTYTASIGQSLTPTSNGAETIRDEFRLTLSHRFSPRVTGGLNLYYYDQEDATSLTTRQRDYTSLSGSLRWAFSRDWGIRGAYRYVLSEFDEALIQRSGSAENHYVFIGFSYQGWGWRL